MVLYLRAGVHGRYNMIKTPYGNRLRVYANYTASGQDIQLVDEVMLSIKENYANVHTSVSHDGRMMNKLFKPHED